MTANTSEGMSHIALIHGGPASATALGPTAHLTALLLLLLAALVLLVGSGVIIKRIIIRIVKRVDAFAAGLDVAIAEVMGDDSGPLPDWRKS